LTLILQQSQHDLFAIGAELATPEPARHGTKMLSLKDVERLEHDIDRLEDQLSPLTHFVIPGGSELSGWLHWARTVCRRAERDVVHLAHQPEVDDCSTIIVYLNRLSDLLFVMARAANQAMNIPDVPWHKPQ
jgi:cob(I)alamin adenosyltransferase